ncbi:MAG: insulinase family protein [Candidatus Aminicenantes bacterium]|nr:insulinase family protein [Candidatus Aminicenantes bacterium]
MKTRPSGAGRGRRLLVAGLLAFGGLAVAEEALPEAPAARGLDNGSALIFQRDAASAVSVLGIVIGGGRAAEPDGLPGLANLVTRLSLEIPDADKVQALMSQSTRMQTLVEEDYALILIESLSVHFEDALKTASAILLKPLFSGLRIDFVKEAMAHQAGLEKDDAVRAGRTAALRAFFGPTGYGASAYGSEAGLKAVRKDDIRRFYQERFRSGNVAFIVVTDLDEARVEAWLLKYFAKLPSGSAPAAPPPPAPSLRDEESVLDKETKQTFCSLAFPLPPLTLESYAMDILLETALGKGVGARLWPLRTGSRLAYNVGARVTVGRAGGVLEAFLETDRAKTAEALAGLETTVAAFAASGFDEDELRTTQVFARSEFLRSTESKTARVRRLAFCQGTGLGIQGYNRFPELLDAVSLAEINAYCRTVLDPGTSARVIIGRR